MGRTVKFVDGICVPNSRNITENHLVGSGMVGLGPGDAVVLMQHLLEFKALSLIGIMLQP